MKKLFLILFTFCLILFSCESETTDRDLRPEGFEISKIDGSFLKNSNKSLKIGYLDNYSLSDVKQIIDSDGNITYLAPSINKTSESLAIYPTNETGVFNYLELEVENNSKKRSINYTDPMTNESVNITFDMSNKEILVEPFLNNNKSCGSETMDCIADIYTNRGWTSVVGWVVTAFVPEIGAAVAVGCAGAALQNGCA